DSSTRPHSDGSKGAGRVSGATAGRGPAFRARAAGEGAPGRGPGVGPPEGVPPGFVSDCSAICPRLLLPRAATPWSDQRRTEPRRPASGDGVLLVCTNDGPAGGASPTSPRDHFPGRSVGLPGVSTSVVLVPGAPALVPELSGAAAAESAGAVAETVEMVRQGAHSATGVEVRGPERAERTVGDVRSSLVRWGVDVPVGRQSAPAAGAEAEVPDAALLGWWFLVRAGVWVPRSFVANGASGACYTTANGRIFGAGYSGAR